MTGTSEKRAVLAITTLGAFLAPFMGSAVNVALPRIAAEFSLGAVTLSWFAMSYMLAAAAFLLPAGGLADRHGRRRVFSIGLALYAAASAGVCAAGSIEILLSLRVIQGLGGAMMFGTSAAILVSAFPAGQRGRVLGWNVAAVYAGLTLGPVIGGLLTARFGWRSLFLINAGFAAAAWAALSSGVRSEWKHGSDGPFDKSGALVSMASLTALMIGFSKLPSAAGAVLVLGGLAGIAGFVFLETRTTHPLLDMNLFRRNRIFAFSNLAALMHYAATAAVSFLLSLYLQTVKGLSPAQAGLALAAQPLVMAVLSPVTGLLSDRVAPRTLASLGMAVSTLGLIGLSTAGRDTAVGSIVSCLLVLGLGFAFFSSPNTNAVMGSVEPRRIGVASAILGTMRLTGQMASMGFAVLLIALFVGSRSLSPESVPDFLNAQRTAFVVCAGLCFAGIFASLARGKTKT